MNFEEFYNKCMSGEIEIDDNIKGLLRVFGMEVYNEYCDLIQKQLLEPLGYELIIRKVETQ